MATLPGKPTVSHFIALMVIYSSITSTFNYNGWAFQRPHTMESLVAQFPIKLPDGRHMRIQAVSIQISMLSTCLFICIHIFYSPRISLPLCFPPLFAVSEISFPSPYLVSYDAFFFCSPRLSALRCSFSPFSLLFLPYTFFLLLHISEFIVLLIDPERQSTWTADISADV